MRLCAVEGQLWLRVMFIRMPAGLHRIGKASEHQKEEKGMQNRRQRIDEQEAQMAGLMPLAHHAAQTAHTAAQRCRDEKMLLRDAPFMPDGFLFIGCHHGIGDDIDEDVVGDNHAQGFEVKRKLQIGTTFLIA